MHVRLNDLSMLLFSCRFEFWICIRPFILLSSFAKESHLHTDTHTHILTLILYTWILLQSLMYYYPESEYRYFLCWTFCPYFMSNRNNLPWFRLLNYGFSPHILIMMPMFTKYISSLYVVYGRFLYLSHIISRYINSNSIYSFILFDVQFIYNHFSCSCDSLEYECN